MKGPSLFSKYIKDIRSYNTKNSRRKSKQFRLEMKGPLGFYKKKKNIGSYNTRNKILTKIFYIGNERNCKRREKITRAQKNQDTLRIMRKSYQIV